MTRLTARTSAVLLGLLLVIAAMLRLYRLGQGLWLDEVLTLTAYARLPFSEILTRYDSQNQHMLYSLLAHASFLLFGESAWALRLPAAIFGVLSIYALYLFGLEITSRIESLMASALLTFSFHHVWFSQNARGYTALLFFTLASSYLLLRAMRTEKPRTWVAYAITVALGMYSHLTMMFVVAGQFTVFVWEHLQSGRPVRRALVPLGAGFVLSVVVTLALLAPVLKLIVGPGLEETHVALWLSPLWTIREALSRLQFGLGIWVAAVLGGTVMLAGFVSLVRARPAVSALFLVPVVTGVGLTVAMNHALWPRFFFFAAGFAMLVMTRGLVIACEMVSQLAGRRAPSGSVLAIGVVLLFIAASAFALPRVYGPKQDYVGARDFVNRSSAPNDLVATAGLAAYVYRGYFAPQWLVVETADDLLRLRERGPTWFVMTMPLHFETRYPDMVGELREHFELVREFPGTVGGGEVLVYRSKREGQTDSSRGAARDDRQ